MWTSEQVSRWYVYPLSLARTPYPLCLTMQHEEAAARSPSYGSNVLAKMKSFFSLKRHDDSATALQSERTTGASDPAMDRQVRPVHTALDQTGTRDELHEYFTWCSSSALSMCQWSISAANPLNYI